MKSKELQKENSSKIVLDFLNKNNLHKKEFAQMIGVTLSYVYNLIDENVPFSTRSMTLERIATVMDIEPEDFIEYQISQDTKTYSKNLLKIKDLIKENQLSTLDFLKKIERKKRLELVDILRGAKPIQIDYEELKKIGDILKIPKEELFSLWKSRLLEHLKTGGLNIENNEKLLNSMFEGAKKEAI